MNLVKIVAILIVLGVMFPIAAAADLLFNGSGSKMFNISVNSPNIDDLSFDIAGFSYNGSFPANISVDIGNDGIPDWQYFVYNSTKPINVTSVSNIWSNNPDDSTIRAINVTTSTLDSMFSFGYVSNNFFQSQNSSSENGILGLTTPLGNSLGGLSAQVLTIYMNNSVVHAFLPSLDFIVSSPGFYISQGGTTYYCNSNNDSSDFSNSPICDLSAAEAMNSSHLARYSDAYYFESTETVKNPNSVKTVNNLLNGCSLPCNISVNVSVGNSGNVSISNLDPIFVYPNITIISPASTTYTSSSISVNVTLNKEGNCRYSMDSGATNISLTANSSNTGFSSIYTASSATYNLFVYCNDSFGYSNSTNVSFTVSLNSGGNGHGSTTTPSGGGGGVVFANTSQNAGGKGKVTGNVILNNSQSSQNNSDNQTRTENFTSTSDLGNSQKGFLSSALKNIGTSGLVAICAVVLFVIAFISYSIRRGKSRR